MVHTPEGSVLYQIWSGHLFLQKLLGDRVPRFGNWVTWPRPRPLKGRFMIHTQEGLVLHFCTKYEADCSISSKVIKGVPKFGNWVTWPKPRPLRGRFKIHTQGGSIHYVCTKFEADSSIQSKVIRVSQHFEIGSRDPGHAHLGVILWSARRRVSPRCLYQIWNGYLFLQKLLEGPQIWKLGHVTRVTPT